MRKRKGKQKRKDEKYRVQITMRGEAARQAKDLLRDGLYGANISETISMLVSEALMLKRDDTKSRYRVVLEVGGYPAYVLNGIADFRGETREKALEQMLFEWTSTNYKMLSGVGLSVPNARRKGYLPKIK